MPPAGALVGERVLPLPGGEQPRGGLRAAHVGARVPAHRVTGVQPLVGVDLVLAGLDVLVLAEQIRVVLRGGVIGQGGVVVR